MHRARELCNDSGLMYCLAMAEKLAILSDELLLPAGRVDICSHQRGHFTHGGRGLSGHLISDRESENRSV